MARSNLAYKQEALEQSYDAQPMPLPRPNLRTIEGQGRDVATRTQSAPWLNLLLITSAVLLVLSATVSIARVSIANATVHMMQMSDTTRSAIDQARSIGLELEVQHSLANNPTRIQDTAAAMGILPADQPATVPAINGFTESTLAEMQQATNEARAAEALRIVGTKSVVAIQAPAATTAPPDDAADESSTQADAEGTPAEDTTEPALEGT